MIPPVPTVTGRSLWRLNLRASAPTFSGTLTPARMDSPNVVWHPSAEPFALTLAVLYLRQRLPSLPILWPEVER